MKMDYQTERFLEKDIKSILYFEIDELLDAIAINLNPEDVFSDDELEIWAKNNGYIKEE